MIKTRFAASPTGWLHIGGLRTALFSYLFAKKSKGQFIMRIEDTDRERFVEGGTENILSSLYWAKIIPDEGVVLDKKGGITEKGKKNGPYIQSARLPIYKKYINKLIELDGAYYCFCAKERLEELRKTQEKNKIAPGYDGHCRNLTAAEAEQNLQAGKAAVVRMKVPKNDAIKFTDLIRGEVNFESNLIDDQVLLKSDGFPTYHFAVVVDDHLMEITHVIRGEEWLPSTPKHILLYKMFGWRAPEFAHLPLLVNERRQKLSKRHGDVAVEDFKAKGYLPEALVNFVAFLGWNPGDDREVFNLKELERNFSLERVGKSPAIFNLDKLNWFNNLYIKKMSDTRLAMELAVYLKNAGLIRKETDKKRLIKLAKMSKDRLHKLSDIVDISGFVFADSLAYEPELLIWKKSDRLATKQNLAGLIKFLETISVRSWAEKNLENKIQTWIARNNHSVGEILWPMRVAMSGQKNSPGPFEIGDVLGKEISLRRLKEAERLL